jgi:tRNA (guanine37-N1)-methyltransferase
MELDVITLFPDSLDWFLGQRHVRNALEAGHKVRAVDPRPYTPLTGRQVDDMPFGGGAGMVLRVDALAAGLQGIYETDPLELPKQRRVIALVPNGRVLDDALVDELVGEPAITLLCGRYEGFDERILEHYTTDRVSLGQYVLAGGELAAMVLCDAIVRKLPGALGHDHSAREESFSVELDGNPEYPHYTRPAEFNGWEVPPVLLSGDHAAIARWRREQAAERGAVPGARLERD